MPYTPRVAGDVNGDGAANDIAFVPAPSSSQGAALAEALRAAPAAALRCLERQGGRVATRNSCTGPWSGGVDLQLSLSPPWPSRDADVQLVLSNAAGAVDRLLHGSARARGWGDTPSIDPTLLVVQGFDPDAREFRYQVNPRFGQRVGTSYWHRPIELRLWVRVPIGPSLTTQQNRTRARLVRASEGDAASLQQVMGVHNVLGAILRLEKSLPLDVDQIDSLRAMEGQWQRSVDSTTAALAAYTESLSDTVPDREVVARVARARAELQATTEAWFPAIHALLTDRQLARLPTYLNAMVTGRRIDPTGSGL
jgi:hypothetical protein